jgi:hypothetical protein
MPARRLAKIGGGRFRAPPLPQLERRLFVSGRGPVGPARYLAAKLGPGDYLWVDELGPWTALALWDPNAGAAALGVFDSGVAAAHTRGLVDALLRLGASLPTLRFGVVASQANRTLESVWGTLDRRLAAGALPARQARAAAPRGLFAGERAFVVYNGVAAWLGQPARGRARAVQPPAAPRPLTVRRPEE